MKTVSHLLLLTLVLSLCGQAFGQAQADTCGRTTLPVITTSFPISLERDSFNREELVSSYATIREFLRKNNILKTP